MYSLLDHHPRPLREEGGTRHSTVAAQRLYTVASQQAATGRSRPLFRCIFAQLPRSQRERVRVARVECYAFDSRGYVY
jgi:hypothetical protein